MINDSNTFQNKPLDEGLLTTLVATIAREPLKKTSSTKRWYRIVELVECLLYGYDSQMAEADEKRHAQREKEKKMKKEKKKKDVVDAKEESQEKEEGEEKNVHKRQRLDGAGGGTKSGSISDKMQVDAAAVHTGVDADAGNDGGDAGPRVIRIGLAGGPLTTRSRHHCVRNLNGALLARYAIALLHTEPVESERAQEALWMVDHLLKSAAYDVSGAYAPLLRDVSAATFSAGFFDKTMDVIAHLETLSGGEMTSELWQRKDDCLAFQMAQLVTRQEALRKQVEMDDKRREEERAGKEETLKVHVGKTLKKAQSAAFGAQDLLNKLKSMNIPATSAVSAVSSPLLSLSSETPPSSLSSSSTPFLPRPAPNPLVALQTVTNVLIDKTRKRIDVLKRLLAMQEEEGAAESSAIALAAPVASSSSSSSFLAQLSSSSLALASSLSSASVSASASVPSTASLHVRAELYTLSHRLPALLGLLASLKEKNASSSSFYSFPFPSSSLESSFSASSSSSASSSAVSVSSSSSTTSPGASNTEEKRTDAAGPNFEFRDILGKWQDTHFEKGPLWDAGRSTYGGQD